MDCQVQLQVGQACSLTVLGIQALAGCQPALQALKEKTKNLLDVLHKKN
jgi:hypothetical protein